MEYCFGIDIGGTTVKCGLFTTEGEILDKWEIPTRTENKGEQILPDIAATIREKMAEKEIENTAVKGIGIGVPAPITRDGIVKDTVNLGWGYKEVKKELEALTGLSVSAGNDANLAALGEEWLGSGKGSANMIMVTLGTGVGGGIIIEGKCLFGQHGGGGEIGHMHVNPHETLKCGCGNTGCLEQYASATGIARIACEKLEKEPERSSMLRKMDNIDAKAVFGAVKAGDTLAIEVAEVFGQYLGTALATLAAICDPEVIVIGGGVSRAGEVLLEYVEKHFAKRAFFINKDTKLVLATLGNDAGICGAARLVLV